MPEHVKVSKPQQKDNSSSTSNQAKQIPLMNGSHPAAMIQRSMISPQSLTYADVMQLQRAIGNRAVGQLMRETGLTNSQPIQGKFEAAQREELLENTDEEPLQMKEENKTGIPDQLKAEVESLSGIDMSDVRVHYNSDKPAGLGALAYTRGTDIHVAPGQEQHLPHEAWHVVQQAQGCVQPTMRMNGGVPVNDNPGLEHEADVMGERAVQMRDVLKAKKEPSDSDDQYLVSWAASPVPVTNKIQTGFRSPCQLKKLKVQVTGITHTVTPLPLEKRSMVDELISASQLFTDNEVEELTEPRMIWIETNNVTLSRRGPNQEEYYDTDLVGPKYYAWYERQTDPPYPHGTGTYIREDTFNLVPEYIPGLNGQDITHKTDTESLRLAAENLILQCLPIPMSTTACGKVFVDSEADYKEFMDKVLTRKCTERGEQVPIDKKSDPGWVRVIAQMKTTHALTELGEVHIREGKGDIGTLIHELIHFYGKQDKFIQDVCEGVSDGFNEGVTEYFTRKVTTPKSVARSGSYSKEYSIVSAVVAKINGYKVLFNAYFLGATKQLIVALQDKEMWPPNSKLGLK
jgi:hypothetical protein